MPGLPTLESVMQALSAICCGGTDVAHVPVPRNVEYQSLLTTAGGEKLASRPPRDDSSSTNEADAEDMRSSDVLPELRAAPPVLTQLTSSLTSLARISSSGIGTITSPSTPRSTAPDVLNMLRRISTSQRPTHGIEAEQQVYIMRHGHRQDEEDPQWHATASHPWNPPLSEKGRQQAREAGHNMKDMGIEYVITSPFVRCLQTSAEIVAAMGLPQGQWLMDWGMCELCDPRLLFAGRPELLPSVMDRQISDWMWGGDTAEAAVDAFIAEEASHSGVATRPTLWKMDPPCFPEVLEQALERYEDEMQAIVKQFERHKVLVVSHGEAVRAAVNMINRSLLVYEVCHTAYVPLSRAKWGGKWRPWKLDAVSGATGVSWYE